LFDSTSFSTLIHAKQVIIASNRGPFEFYLTRDNQLEYRRGPGGLVTALTAVAKLMNATWIAMAMTEGDRQVSKTVQQENGRFIPLFGQDQNLKLRYVSITEKAYRKYYEKISNELLWFTHSYIYEIAKELTSEQEVADAWTNGYCVANQAIAEAIVTEISQDEQRTVILLQDCFLFLVSSMIRSSHPKVLIQQFLHWPWPDIRYWCFLPSYITQAIYQGLAGNDIIGFQTRRDMRNFLDGASAMLEGAVVDFEKEIIWYQGRSILVRTYPVSISIEDEFRIIQSEEGQQETRKIHSFLHKKIIMRVDRLDPIKNIIRGFQAYAQILDNHPEFLNEVVFLAFLVPTRENAAVYRHYSVDVSKIIEDINNKYGSDEWKPIHAWFGNNRVRALAALQFYDVLLVNPIIESMNLVAKEGSVLNQRDGVLVLSRNAGSFMQLGKVCLPVSPTNTNETAQALYEGLTMPQEERQTRSRQARMIVENYSLHTWLLQQIQDINQLLDTVKFDHTRDSKFL